MLTLQVTREECGWSRAELARRAGLNAATVGAIESGRLTPYESQLVKLARAFGMSIHDAGKLTQEADRGGRRASR